MEKRRARKAKGAAREATYLKFRVRWRHVLLIDQRIRSGPAPNCRQLAGELEVSQRTVLRDVDFLRYDLGAPIEYDPANRGYIYTEPNWVMPSVRITEGELFALMVAEKALDAYAGTPWAERLRKVFDRMVTSLPDRIEVAPAELLPRVDFEAGAAAIVDPNVLATVSRAVTENQTLRIRYQPLGRPEAREYLVDPYVLRRARGAWYLAARDHRSGYVPLLNLTRFRSVEPTGQRFDYEAAGFDPKVYFARTFGVFQAPGRHEVTIAFSGFAAQLVRERQWHASQKLKDLPGGRLRFEVEVSHLWDIWPWVLSWGSEAKVLRPKELMRLVADEAARAAAQYSGSKRRSKARGGKP